MIVITVEKIHFMKEIKLKENPLRKHCITLYVNIKNTIVSNRFIFLKILKSHLSFNFLFDQKV